MKLADGAAIFLTCLAVVGAFLVTDRVFERMPHIEDEIALVWQAEVIAQGDLTIPSPPHPKSFLVPFVVDFQGRRFGKYPLGWPALLSLGVRLDARYLVNPLLSGLAIWLIYCLGKKLMGETVGLLAAGLTLTSPFFLMNSGTLLSHPLGLVLSLAFVLAWLEMVSGRKDIPAGLPVMTAGLAWGVLALTRPLTALGVALPFGVHGLVLLWRGGSPQRRRVLLVGVQAALFVGLHFLWQYALTGDPLRNPYTLWWPYDRIGFGPGIGVKPGGHTISQAWTNTKFSLLVGVYDLFGWGPLAWIFIPFGLWAIRRDARAWLAASVFPSLVVTYCLYWVGAWLFGPRYYFEGLYSLTLISAAGVAWLAGWLPRCQQVTIGWRKVRSLGISGLLILLVAINLRFYTPQRLKRLVGLYGIRPERLRPFQTKEASELTPALVIVHAKHWTEYGALLELEDPYLQAPFIFAYSRGDQEDKALAEDFPERQVLHYYPEEPYVFYEVRR